MAALWTKEGHYIFVLWFLLSIFLSFILLFPRLFSAVVDWMSTIYFHTWCGLSANLGWSETCCTRIAHRWNTGRKKIAKIRHLGTIAQRYRAISSQLRHVSTVGKTCQTAISPHMSLQYGELRPTNSWELLVSLGHPSKFQRVSRLGSITARHSSTGVCQTLRRWTEGATYIRQGGHQVGHWPTF